MFKVNIAKYLDREIHRTELALLQAEDELNEAQYRVKTIRSRLARLQGKQRKAAAPDNKALAALLGISR
jgi:outer membrane protein TolC